MNMTLKAFALFALVAALAVPLHAEDAGGTAGAGKETGQFRVLGDTRFMSTAFIPSPFVTTDLRNTMGIGKAPRVKTPILVIDDDVVLGLEGDLLYALLDARYQYAVQDWVAVWGGFKVNARLGNELQTVLAQGVSVYSGFNLGWLFRVWNNERHLMSAAVSLNNSSTAWFDIYQFVSDAIDSGGITPDNKLVNHSPAITSSFDLRYALAASDMVGIQALVRSAFGESVDRSTGTEWTWQVGLAAHLDLLDSTGVPIGLIGGYRTGTIPTGDDVIDRAQSFLFNISYTGREEIGLGLDIEYDRLPMRGFDDPVGFTSAVITMQFFF